MAYDYVPSGTYGRSFSGTRVITDRQWWRYKDSYNSAQYGSSRRFEAGWSQPVWVQNPGPIVRANNSTRIKWQPSGNSMVDYEKSDSQNSEYSCDALFNRPEYFYHPPGEAPWVKLVNPAFNWSREVYINVDWAGVAGGLTYPNILEVIGIPSFLQYYSGIDRSSQTGLLAGADWPGYVSIGAPQGATAQSHSTGWIDQH